ncbi:MAG: peptidase domain-containing ABC transporter [Prevotella sp.]|jgi:ATP-binding cassette subfamily B protein|nr:peptidase domain-containing ABC transporter [Prevotella sp.]
MKRFPFIKQLDAMDCGPACLKMISAYYGRDISLDKIRKYASIGKDGVSLKGISNAAENIGFRSQGGKITTDILMDKAPLPCIIYWNQNHFVVLFKIKKKKTDIIYSVADPAKGILNYSEKDFLDSWLNTQSKGTEKGVVLLLEPSNLFYNQNNDEKSKQNKTLFLVSYIKKYKRFFFQLILGLLVGSILQLVFPFLTQAIVDTGIERKDIHFIWLILIAQMMLLFSRTAIDFVRRKLLLHISVRINVSLISDFFIKLMKLPMKFFDTKLTGDLLQRIEDHKRVENFLTNQVLSVMFSAFSFVIFSIVLFVYNIPIFLIFLTGSLIYGIWIMFFLKKRRVLDYTIFEKEGNNRNAVYQLITGMQEIKLQGCEQRKRWEWEDIQADLFDVNLQSLNLKQTQDAGGIFINELKNTIVTILAATAVINGELTLGMMLAIQYIIGQLNSPVEQIMNFIYQWQDVSISLERMNEIQMQDNEEDERHSISNLPADCSIHIRNLYFKYDGALSHYVLKNINLTIPQNKVTAIVGASGSGKTTLIKLLLGYYLPTEGSIYIDQNELEKFSLTWWRMACGAVMQEGHIFSDTIARNIAISDDEINLDRLRQAASVANISNYIENLPLGYNTKIGQDGQGVSQGQRQRILIARIVYKNPAFVFFDEATNALDANNEKKIVENLEEFYKDKTVIIVAHRLSTVKNADQIVVLDDGCIVEIGSHDQLTKKQGKYYELVKNQLELGN